ncbi:hypothetical protein BGX26_011105 [Mortierella sp. AD094]|nr:hypothetical protein BGX26_011105 [Mortierella sp. AD094]
MVSRRKVYIFVVVIFFVALLSVFVEARERKDPKPHQKNPAKTNKLKHADDKELQKKKHNKDDKHEKTNHKDKHNHGQDDGRQDKGQQDKMQNHHSHMSHHHHKGTADRITVSTDANQHFGQCGTDAMASQDSRKQWRRKKHGFDLEERRRSLPNQDGRRSRIPPSVGKLPGKDVLVNIAYFPGWTQYRGQGRNNCHQRPYLPSAIPWSSLDYVMFAFVYFDEDNELYPADPSDENLYF